jgi:hypothetical protein
MSQNHKFSKYWRIRRHSIVGIVAVIWCLLQAQSLVANAYDNSSIEFYMNYAFRTNDRLLKFATSPKPVIWCRSLSCNEVATRVARRLPTPPPAKIIVSNQLLPTFQDIIITDSGEALSSFEDNFNKSIQHKAILRRNRGWKGCTSIQFVVGYEVVGLAVKFDNTAAVRISEVCVLAHLVYGSGGEMPYSITRFLVQYEKAGPKTQEQILRKLEFILDWHWDSHFLPGETSSEVQANLKARGFAPRKTLK